VILLFLQRFLLYLVCLISVLFVVCGIRQLTNEDGELDRVSFAWGLIFIKEKAWFSAPCPFGMSVGFVEGICVSTSLAASCWNSWILWVPLGNTWWLLLLSAVSCVSESLVSDSIAVCCWKRTYPEQMNLRSLPFCRVLRTDPFSKHPCPCCCFLGWSRKASILPQLCCFWDIETVPFSCVLFDRHFSLLLFLIDLTAVDAPFRFAGNKCLYFECSPLQL